ncbi:MAG: SDR family NAD(P)-dependent oxidoreductase [Actinobacteria bacterium]|nr:SDR family NAD(P)-dependent oxidoreductase [Actinomycetota bacterium]
MKRKTDLKGKEVLITGGASGIGLSTAREFAKHGATPILVDINRAALNKAVSEFKDDGKAAYGFEADITSRDKLAELKKELEHNSLSPDILVNSAGITLVGHWDSHTDQDWERMFSINVMGTLNTIKAFLPCIQAKGEGHIVNIGSLDGLVPMPSQSAYCASKFAVTALTEVLHFDMRHSGIGVTLVCPGSVTTPMAASFPLRDINTDFKGSGIVWKLVQKISNTPEKIADHIVDAVKNDKYLVIPGMPSRAFYRFRRHFPRLATSAGVSASKLFTLARKLMPKPLPGLQT